LLIYYIGEIGVLNFQGCKKNELIQEFLNKINVFNTIKKIFNINYCSICIKNPITHVLILCGHTFCIECINKSFNNQNNKCPMCRIFTENIYKIFI